MAPTIVLHAVPPSHPCMTVEAALRLKGLSYERVDWDMSKGEHPERMREIYGEGNSTVPGALIDGEPVHGSRKILARLEELVDSEPRLYPSEAVREAERWGDEELQDLGRRLPWGVLHFRPEALGTFAPGGKPLDGAGTDFAIAFVRGCWRYHRITAARLEEDLAGLPEKLDRIEQLARDGVLDGEQANAADLQIGATIRVLMVIGDLRGLLDGSAALRIAMRWFPEFAGEVPVGGFPLGWVPAI